MDLTVTVAAGATLHLHMPADGEVTSLVKTVINSQGKIMASQAQTESDLKALTAQVTKSRTEQLAKIAALQAAIDAAGNSTPEVDAAMKELKAAVQLTDDDNPDATDPNAP